MWRQPTWMLLDATVAVSWKTARSTDWFQVDVWLSRQRRVRLLLDAFQNQISSARSNSLESLPVTAAQYETSGKPGATLFYLKRRQSPLPKK